MHVTTLRRDKIILVYIDDITKSMACFQDGLWFPHGVGTLWAGLPLPHTKSGSKRTKYQLGMVHGSSGPMPTALQLREKRHANCKLKESCSGKDTNRD